MLDLLLPQRADNAFRGQKAALFIFALAVLLRTIQGLNSAVNPTAIATGADGIPLSHYAAEPAATIVALFALIGVANFVIALTCWMMLWRYRALVPLMFAILLVQQAGGVLSRWAHPVPRVGSPPSEWLFYVILGVMLAGFALSLWKRTETAL